MSLLGWPEPHSAAEEGTDHGSMLMALLVTLVAMALSASLVPIVISQIARSRTISARTMALDAAQTGIDVALGQLRSAVDATGKGSVVELPPCSMAGVVGVAGSRYHVTIDYYGAAVAPDPCRPPTDLPRSAALTATGGGPLVESLAVGSAGTRTVTAIYTFHTTNENIPGGAIRAASPLVDPLCLDAGPTTSPPTGTPVTMEQCVAGGISGQRFAYTTDLNIMLVGSERAGASIGMCLEAPRPHKLGGLVTLQPCLGRVAHQQWSLDDNSRFRGTTDGVKDDGFCISIEVAATEGSKMVLSQCNVSSGQNEERLRPEPGVGAGMASAETHQLVNYQQFSRCLDVTNRNVSYTYLIVWFCKQSPNGDVTWNQQWSLPPLTTAAASATPERIRTTGIGNPGYCLRTPASTLADQYVTMTACTLTGALDTKLEWTVYGDTGDYATSYRVVDSSGFCLTPTDLTVEIPDVHVDGTAKVKVAQCDDSELQKWNAPPNFNTPLTLTNIREK